MSRIDALIAELCPDGVAFEPLRSIGTWYGGGTPSKDKAAFWQDGSIPWLSPKDMGKPVVTQTEDYITPAAVTGSATKLVPANSIAIVVRSSILDKVLPTALVPIPITLNQDMKAVVPREDVIPSYIAHLLRSRGPELLRVARKTGGSVASIEMPRLMAFRIPVPPIHVQREIVKVLDTFAELETELEAELVARRRQYAYYREALLSFTERTERSTINDQRSTINDQRSTINDQRSTINDQRSTINDQRSTINDQRSTIKHTVDSDG